MFSGGSWSDQSVQLEVQGRVNGVVQEVLLDTGASLCLTSPHFFEERNPELAEHIEKTMRPTRQHLQGCTGTATKCRGVLGLTVSAGGHEWFEPEVYVMDDCPHPFIVSWPALVREDFKLFAKAGTFQFGEGPLCETVDAHPSTAGTGGVRVAASVARQKGDLAPVVKRSKPPVLVNIDGRKERALRRAARLADGRDPITGAVFKSRNVRTSVKWSRTLAAEGEDTSSQQDSAASTAVSGEDVRINKEQLPLPLVDSVVPATAVPVAEAATSEAKPAEVATAKARAPPIRPRWRSSWGGRYPGARPHGRLRSIPEAAEEEEQPQRESSSARRRRLRKALKEKLSKAVPQQGARQATGLRKAQKEKLSKAVPQQGARQATGLEPALKDTLSKAVPQQGARCATGLSKPFKEELSQAEPQQGESQATSLETQRSNSENLPAELPVSLADNVDGVRVVKPSLAVDHCTAPSNLTTTACASELLNRSHLPVVLLPCEDTGGQPGNTEGKRSLNPLRDVDQLPFAVRECTALSSGQGDATPTVPDVYTAPEGSSSKGVPHSNSETQTVVPGSQEDVPILTEAEPAKVSHSAPSPTQATADAKAGRRTQARKQRKAKRKIEHELRNGSQPSPSRSRNAGRANTRARGLKSPMAFDYPRVCPVKKVLLPVTGPANVAYTTTIPGMSEMNVAITLVHDDTNDRGAAYLFEPTPIPLMKGRMWRAAASLTTRQKSGELLVRVMNPTSTELTLFAGATMGTWEHLSMGQVAAVRALEKKPAERTPRGGVDAGLAENVFTAAKVMVGDPLESATDASPADDERRVLEALDVNGTDVLDPLARTVFGDEGVEIRMDDKAAQQDAVEEVVHATDAELRAKVDEGGDHLDAEQKEKLFTLLQKFKYVFRKKPGRTDVVKHVIDTGDNRPIRGGRYRQSEKDRATIREIVKDMSDMGVVRPSHSPWGASVVLVPKKDGSTRFCVDYRRLNEITAKDVYPLPRIDATLDQLGGCKYFTAMDLTSGYWQVDMDEKDAAKTAFITPDGLYEFTAMPFGLCNAPATFQRLMDNVLGSLRYEYALVYLDDVMVHSKTFEEHLEHLETVLTCLQDATLACKLKKCSFAQESTVYLGHVVSGQGIAPEPSKLDAVKVIAPPRSVKEIRMFLGFVGYYRRFINNFSAIAQPLNALLRKTVEWTWGTEQQDAFEALREALISAPILEMPDFTKKFTVRTDASYSGLGACLLQGEGDDRKPIAYASRSLKPAETRYTATEIECLGMKWAVKTFRPYIHGRRFIMETDHIALKWLRTVQHTNGRLIRTAMEMQQYEMDIVHRAGIKMYDADALSRLRTTRDECTGPEIATVLSCVTDQAIYYGEGDPTPPVSDYDEPTGPCPVMVKLLQAERQQAREAEWLTPNVGTANPVYVAMGQEGPEDSAAAIDLKAKVKEEMLKDTYYAKLYQQLTTEDLPPEELTVRLRNDLSKFVVQSDGLLYRIEQLYRGGRAMAGKVRYLLWVPEVLRPDVLFSCHDHLLSGGHLGVQKTFAKLRMRYYWTGMFRTVEDWCKSCASCASRKNPRGIEAPLAPLPVPTEPFQMISVDVLGPFVAAEGSGNKYVLVYCDHLTRWVETVAFRRNDSAVMARVLVERIMCRHGAPQVILSDRGRPFMSALAKEVYRLLRVKKVSTAAYRPQTNGLVERFNRTLASMLSMYVNSKHKDWDRYLPYVTFAYNTAVHASTKETPFFLLYGREARLPLDTQLLPMTPHEHLSVEEYRAELVEGLRVAHEFGREALLRDKQQQELRRGPGKNVPVFEVGDLVQVKNPALHNTIGLTRKLTNAWTGPFKVLAKMGPTTYRVTGVSGRGRAVSVNRLKKHYDYDHPEVEESDYCTFFEEAGEPMPGEGNRTYAPTAAEAALPPGDGEAVNVTDEPVIEIANEEPPATIDVSEDTQGTSAAGTASTSSVAERSSNETPMLEAVVPAVTKPRGRPRIPPPTGTTIVRRQELGPELGLATPVPPGGGMRNLCKRCHQPKRNHQCTGRYVPARQLTIARRRLGLADPGTAPIFGIVDTKNEIEVFGVYAPNDVRKMNVIDTPESWEKIAESNGQTGSHIWAEYCFKCDGRGQVYGCYGCNLAFHPRCSVRPLLARRLTDKEEFLCPDCLRDCVDPASPHVEITLQDGTVLGK